MSKIRSIVDRYKSPTTRHIETARHRDMRAHIEDAIRRVSAAAPAALERERQRKASGVVELPRRRAAPAVSADQRRRDRLAEFAATGTVKRPRRRKAKVHHLSSAAIPDSE
jgi:hypothetical protein